MHQVLAETETGAGSGYADLPDAREAGATAARRAMEEAGHLPVDFAFCFYHGRHDGAAVLDGVREVLGPDVPVLGGTAAGVITNEQLGYEGHQVGVAVVSAPRRPIAVATASGLDERGEAAVGRDLGGQIAEAMGEGADVLFLWSSIKRGVADAGGAALFHGTPLVEGLLGTLGTSGTVAGGGTMDSLQIAGSTVIGAGGIDPVGATALGLGPGLRLDTVILHGCRPGGAYHTITRVDGAVVLEIDGRPALDVVDELMPESRHDDYPFRLLLGVNRGDRYGPFDPENYQIRLCLGVDEERRAFEMFEPDLEAGTDVQIMQVTTGFRYVRERVEGLLARLDGRKPLFALYIDCLGRCGVAAGTDEEEADAVREALGEIPLLGFYTGVEVADVAGTVRPLDFTGVVCLLSVD